MVTCPLKSTGRKERLLNDLYEGAFRYIHSHPVESGVTLFVIVFVFLSMVIPMQVTIRKYQKRYRQLRDRLDLLLQTPGMSAAQTLVISQSAKDLADTRTRLMEELTHNESSSFLSRHTAYQTALLRVKGIEDNLDALSMASDSYIDVSAEELVNNLFEDKS